MGKVLIVVASHEAARVFEAEAGTTRELIEREDLFNPSARRHRGDLESDRAGRYSAEAGSSVHGMEREHGPKDEALSRYVRELAALVDDVCRPGGYGRIYLVADPHVLGALREALGAAARAAVAGELSKNLVKHSGTEIRQHLPESL